MVETKGDVPKLESMPQLSQNSAFKPLLKCHEALCIVKSCQLLIKMPPQEVVKQFSADQ